MRKFWFWLQARFAAFRRRKEPEPSAPVIVGQAFLDNYETEWARLQDRFVGYIRANPDGAQMLKDLSAEEVARMSADAQPMFVATAPRKDGRY